MNIPLYGHHRDTTPNLEKLASDGIIYQHAISPSPWSLPSHASLFTGCNPSEHGAHEKTQILPEESKTLAQVLKENEYDTLGVSSNSWVSSEFGMRKGFDEFIPIWKLFDTEIDSQSTSNERLSSRLYRYFQEGVLTKSIANIAYRRLYYRRYDYGATRVNLEFKRRLESLSKPFFTFINYFEPHLRYGPPRFREEFTNGEDLSNINQEPWPYVFGATEMSDSDFESLQDLYDAELRYTDYRFGQLLERLKQSGEYEDSLIIVTSDHGENIGDHGLMDHQYSLHNTLLHVPLVIKYPASLEVGSQTVSSVVSTADIVPTVLELLDIEDSISSPETSEVLPPLKQPDKGRFVVSEYLEPIPPIDRIRQTVPDADDDLLSRYDRSISAVQNIDEKFIKYSSGESEYYNIRDDPRERVDRSEELDPDKRAMLKSLIEQSEGEYANRSAEKSEMSQAVKSNLEDLGYLG